MFIIKTQVSGYTKCVTVSSIDVNNANVVQWEFTTTGHSSNQWYFEEAYGQEQSQEYIGNEKVYFIRNEKSNLYMDVYNGNITNGTNIQQYYFNGNPSQMFRLEAFNINNEIWYEIHPLVNLNSCVDVAGCNPNDGANIQIYEDNSSASQRFKIVPVSPGEKNYKILTQASGFTKAIVVENASMYSGANIFQWGYGYDYEDNDQWYFEEAFVNWGSVNNLSSNQTKSLNITFPDNKYYNFELYGNSIDTKMTILGYESNPIIVDKSGVEKDKICIRGVQGKTITINISINNGGSGATYFKVYKMRSVMYGILYDVYDTRNFIDSPYENMKEVCLPFKYKDKLVNHILENDERYLQRLNSDIVYLVGSGNDYSFMFNSVNNALVQNDLINLDRCKFIYFNNNHSAKEGVPSLCSKAIQAGAITALGYKSHDMINHPFNSDIQKTFGEWLFYFIKTNNNTINAAVSETITAMRDTYAGYWFNLYYSILGDQNQILFPSNPSYRSYSFSQQFEEIQNSGYDYVFKLGENTERFYKTINGIITDDYYDVIYENGEILKINKSRNNITEIVLPIKLYKSATPAQSIIKYGEKYNFYNSFQETMYLNINNIMTPIEFNYNFYEYNDFENTIADFKCYNLNDGSEIDYSIINFY